MTSRTFLRIHGPCPVEDEAPRVDIGPPPPSGWSGRQEQSGGQQWHRANLACTLPTPTINAPPSNTPHNDQQLTLRMHHWGIRSWEIKCQHDGTKDPTLSDKSHMQDQALHDQAYVLKHSRMPVPSITRWKSCTINGLNDLWRPFGPRMIGVPLPISETTAGSQAILHRCLPYISTHKMHPA